ncbi:hypothetical protein HELRODRAFT_160179 [Helobdella robusta]|uniref:Ig-like domain-containing protein n=1 Tax=Helobdella robusta TaxID=6412 RepID=T1EPX6_HELRO|nr:hypothetical protein HELRODRAFT_160179 [Helobdella robusta]ESO06055.1 hypothetical protein HELRODRAFT_160179 [Helobdella robusta]
MNMVLHYKLASSCVACRLEIKPKTKSLVKPLNNSLLFTCEKVSDDGGYEDDEDGVDDFNGGRIKLKWFNKYGEEIVGSSGRIYVESGYNSIKLFITTIKEEDDGDYTCKNIASAVSDDNVEMASISLSVYKDITFEDAPEKQYIEIHSSSTIKCVVSGLPVPFVSWRFNGRKISPVPPSMTKHMLDVQEVAEAGNVTLSCSAHAMPSPTYQFFKTAKTKNNEMAQQGARIHSLPKKITIDPVKGIMVIMNVSKLTGDDDYIYQCLAVNKLGNDSSFGQIKILTPPVISLQPIVVTTKNSKVTIECASTGDPLPDLSFMRNGEKLMSDFLPNKGRHVLNEVNQTYLLLEISDVEVEDAGTYTCASNNSVGYDEKGIDLVVQYAPVFVGYKSSLKRMHAWPGVSINMSCRVRAVPRPVVQWFVMRNTPGDGGEDGYQVVHDGGKVYKVFESEEGPLLQITVEKKDDEISSDNHTDVRDKNIDDDERNIFTGYMCKAVNDHRKQKKEADWFSQNPRPVFTGPVCESVGFRTTLACFHWAVKSDRLSHDQGPVFTGPVSQSVDFRTTLACFHWAVKSDRLSHDQGPVFTGPVSQSVDFRTTPACFHWAVESDRLSHDQHKTTRVRTTLETNCVSSVRVRNYANEHSLVLNPLLRT